MQKTFASILFVAILCGTAIGEGRSETTTDEGVSGQSTTTPTPPAASESRRKRMLDLIRLLNADDGDAMLSEYLGLMPGFTLQTSPFHHGHRVTRSTIESRIRQYEKAYQIQAAFEQLKSSGIDHTLAVRLCRDPDVLRSTIRALRTLSSLRESK